MCTYCEIVYLCSCYAAFHSPSFFVILCAAIVFGAVLVRNSVVNSFDLMRFERTETEALQRAQFLFHFLSAPDTDIELLM